MAGVLLTRHGVDTLLAVLVGIGVLEFLVACAMAVRAGTLRTAAVNP